MINYNIRIKRATSSRWNSINPILSAGELGLETNTGKIKAGNGLASWTELNYIGPNNTNLLAPVRNYYGYIGEGYWEDLTKWVSYDGNSGETIWDGVPATQLPTENDYVVIHGQIIGAKNFIDAYHVTLESYYENSTFTSSYLAGITLNCDIFICDSTAYDIDGNEAPYSTFIFNGTIVNAATCYFIGEGEGGNGGIVNAKNTYIESYSSNGGIINGNVYCDGVASNLGKINGNIEFHSSYSNLSFVYGNAIFYDITNNFGSVNENAIFLNNSSNDGNVGAQIGNNTFVYGQATFFDNSSNNSLIDGYPVYYDNAADNS